VSGRRVLILGAGKIGSLITCLLARSGGYDVHLASRRPGAASDLIDELGLGGATGHELDAARTGELDRLLAREHFDAVVSALPFDLNPGVVDQASARGVNYFDLTEDVGVTRYIREISAGSATAFMPQCGFAPGFINIVAADLMARFTAIDSVKLRGGALPLHSANALKYALTWSTQGLINEYLNPCEAVEQGEHCTVRALEGLESLVLGGVAYEAFNTSGGLGTLADTYRGQVQTMNYKSIRYPGHRDAVKLLLQDLGLGKDRAGLKDILENALPATLQDIVLAAVFVSGRQAAGFFEESYFRAIHPQEIGGRTWSAIQVATAAGLCGAMDVVLGNPERYRGFVTQESVPLAQFMNTSFGHYYA